MDAHSKNVKGGYFPRFDAAIARQWLLEHRLALASTVEVRFSQEDEYQQILSMLEDSGGIVRPYPAALRKAITEDRSIVATDLETGKIIAHQRYEMWPDLQMAELRTAFVKPAFRGRGLNTMMKQLVVADVFDRFPGWTILGFCKPSSLSINIFLRIGFEPVSLEEVSEQWPELSRECRTDACYLLNGHHCGCAVSRLTEPNWRGRW